VHKLYKNTQLILLPIYRSQPAGTSLTATVHISTSHSLCDLHTRSVAIPKYPHQYNSSIDVVLPQDISQRAFQPDRVSDHPFTC